MPINNIPALDALALLVQAIGRDRKLRQWFLGLTQKSILERQLEIYRTADRMTAQLEDAELIASTKLLADPKTFAAILQTLREHGHIKA